MNTRSILDTRDLQERLEELEGERQSFVDSHEDQDPEKENHNSWEDAWGMENPSDEEELKALKSLKEEVGSEWRHGATLIPDSKFEDYARELAEDIGAIDRNASWPNNFIDWPAAAEALQMDYSQVAFQGTDYWYRA